MDLEQEVAEQAQVVKSVAPTQLAMTDELGFVIYVLDTETTGLDEIKNDVIELSIYRLSDDSQKTWCLKPLDMNNIEAAALRINGHKIEDIKHETKFGRDTYLPPGQVVVDVENWMAEDGVTSEDRILLGQNPAFDKKFLERLWQKCNAEGTFPFGRKMMDTIQIALLMDIATGNKRKAYGLGALVEDFGIKKEKAHRAEGDTKMTKDLWLKQLEIVKEAFTHLKKSK